MNNHYEVLGLPLNASDEQIKKVYRKLAQIYHPDTTILDHDHAHRKFQELNDAYEILSNPNKRASYDRNLAQTPADKQTRTKNNSQKYPKPSLSQQKIDFGDLFIGEQKTEKFFVYNRGGPITHLIDFQYSEKNSWFTVSNINKLFETEPCPIEVEVTAKTDNLIQGRRYNGWVEVYLDGETAHISLTMYVTHKAKLTISTDRLDFGSLQVNQPYSLKFRIENMGGLTDLIPTFRQSNNSEWFNITRTNHFSDENPYPMDVEVTVNPADLLEDKTYNGWLETDFSDGDIRRVYVMVHILPRPQPKAVIAVNLYRRLQRHTEGIWSIAFSPDGQQLVSGGVDNQLWLWEAATNWQARGPRFWGMRKFFKLGPATDVQSVTFNPAGNQIAFTSWEKIMIWSLDNNWRMVEFNVSPGYHSHNVRFSPNGQYLLADSAPGDVWLWDVQSRQVIKQFSGHDGDVRTVAFSPNGQVVATGSEDGIIRLWDIDSGKETTQYSKHTGAVRSIAFSPDGLLLASAGSVSFVNGLRHEDKSVRVWRLETGDELFCLNGHTQSVECVVFNPQSDILVSSSVDTTVRFWDVQTGQEIDTLTDHTRSVSQVTFSRDGRLFASAGWDGSIGLYEIS